jgi:hypothetical protein
VKDVSILIILETALIAIVALIQSWFYPYGFKKPPN